MTRRSPHTRPERAAALAALVALCTGIGMLGWLAGHLVAYAATGDTHAHAGHGYMEPIQRIGGLLAVAGIVLAVAAVTVGRSTLRGWVLALHASRGLTPWLVAALAPTATFLIVELAEGSVLARGGELLLVGLPLQAGIGVLVLAVVRLLLDALVRVADHLAGARPLRPAPHAPADSTPPGPVVRHRRVAPMAVNGALRAPPAPLP